MLAATATMWDTLGWGGETQALLWHPQLRKVIAINGLGVAPTGATPEFFRAQGLAYPPAEGPLAAVTPGTPGALLVMLAEYGRLSLAQVLQPAIEMADGYPIEQQLAETLERNKAKLSQWPASAAVFLPHPGEARETPRAGELFRQADLKATLEKLVESERLALAAGLDRKAAIYAAYDRFYRGDIALDLVGGVQELGGLFTAGDLDRWKVEIEEPVSTSYKGIEVYKLNVWTQGPAMLQALNILEPIDLAAMGYNSAREIHTVYQAMNLAFADRDFYYGDPYSPPEEPVQGPAVEGVRRRTPQAHRPAAQRPGRSATATRTPSRGGSTPTSSSRPPPRRGVGRPGPRAGRRADGFQLRRPRPKPTGPGTGRHPHRHPAGAGTGRAAAAAGRSAAAPQPRRSLRARASRRPSAAAPPRCSPPTPRAGWSR